MLYVDLCSHSWRSHQLFLTMSRDMVYIYINYSAWSFRGVVWIFEVVRRILIFCLWLNNQWPKASERRRRGRSGVVWRGGGRAPHSRRKNKKIGSLRCSLVLSKRQIYCDKYCPVMPNLWKVIQSAIQSTICQNTFILDVGYIINIYCSCLTVIQLHIKSGSTSTSIT